MKSVKGKLILGAAAFATALGLNLVNASANDTAASSASAASSTETTHAATISTAKSVALKTSQQATSDTDGTRDVVSSSSSDTSASEQAVSASNSATVATSNSTTPVNTNTTRSATSIVDEQSSSVAETQPDDTTEATNAETKVALQTAKSSAASVTPTAQLSTKLLARSALSSDSDSDTPVTIEVDGLGAADATITDNSNGGADVTDAISLSATGSYNVGYTWSIPDGLTVSAGDTATFTLPATVVAKPTTDTTFNLYLTGSETVIATVALPHDSATGTITFTDALASTTYNRKGTMNVNVVGTTTSSSGNDSSTTVIAKGGWTDGNSTNNDGQPTKVYWDILYNMQNATLHDAVITDTLGAGQTYNADSMVVKEGTIAGNVIASDAAVITPTSVVVNGNTITINLGDLTSGVYITYSTQITNPGNGGTLTNSASGTSSDGNGSGSTNVANAQVSWGGTGDGDGQVGAVTLTKYATGTTTALSNATFDLYTLMGHLFDQDSQPVLLAA